MNDDLTTVPSATAIRLVARRELLTRLRSRAFTAGLATTVILVFAIFGMGRLLDDGPADLTVAVVGDQPTGLADVVAAVTATEGGTIDLEPYDDLAAARTDLDDGTIDAAVVDGREVVVTRLSDDVANLVLPIWQQARLVGELADAGTDPAVVASAQEPLTVTETAADGDRDTREAVAVGTSILLFVAVQVGGSFLMMGVLEEKGTKVIEILLSSLRPRDLLAGKLLGIGVVGLIQVAVLVATVLVASGLFDSNVVSAIEPGAVAMGLVWFLVGYLLWGSLYAAAASLATGMEDAQSTLTPVTVGVLLSYFLATYVATSPGTTAARIASWIPVVAPFAMPGRVAGGDVAAWEVGLVLAGSVATTLGVLVLAERIYVRSVLTVDRKVSWREALSGSSA